MSARDVYLVTYRTGHAWVQGRGSKEQPAWGEHTDYLNHVEEDGNRLLIGGPLEDYSEIHLAIEADSADQVRSLLANEPWIKRGTLEIVSVKQWLLLVDPR